MIALVTVLGVSGQTKVGADQQRQVLEKIDKAALGLSALQCDFTQTKRMKLLNKDMKSKGVMYFKKPNKLRWQYVSPYDYIFILNGNQVQLKSAKSTKNIDVQGNKMFRQISDIILNSITGGNLKNSSDFSLELYQGDHHYFAKLYPKKKELKQIYDYIEIHFNPALTMVSSVKMAERTGDYTLVNLINPQTGISIDEKMFKID